MGIKADHWIKKMALEHGMIEPFVENQVREGVISYGLSSYGYDIRLSNEFKFLPIPTMRSSIQRTLIVNRWMILSAMCVSFLRIHL